MGFKIFSKLVIFFIICVVVPITSSYDSKIYPAVFNFGDSNSDTGNYAAAMGAPSILPNGQTYFKKPSGRVCDGRLIIDFLMEALNFPYLNPYLDSIGAPSFINGTNFAVAGNMIDKRLCSNMNPFDLGVQTNQFLRFKAKVEEMHVECANFNPYIPPQKYFAKALYMFDIGQNDLTVLLYSKSLEEIRNALPGIMSLYEEYVTKLYNNGARNFWIHNTGPLGCLPAKILFNGNSTKLDEFGCVIAYNEAAKAFNLQLHALFKRLQGRYSDANLTYVDIFTIKLNLITNYSKYGFEQNIMTCCGYGGPPLNYISPFPGCGRRFNQSGTLVPIKSCDDSRKYVNWDGIHYTEAANHYVASEILTGKYSIHNFRQ